MKNENLVKTVLLPCFVLAAGVALAATSNDFEDSSLEGLSGDGTVVSGESVVPSVGAPITSSTANANILSHEGVITHTAGNDTVVDFLLYATEDADALADPDADTKIALAVSNGKWAVYCKNKADDVAKWVTTATPVAMNAWSRITLSFATEGYCDIKVNGIGLASDAGYLSSSSAERAGSLYKIVTDGNTIANVSLAGISQIDHLVVGTEAATFTSATVDLKDKAGQEIDDGWATVSVEQLNTWGVSAETAATTSIDGSGMTVVEKLELGYAPDNADHVFEPKSMTLATENDAQVAVVEFPAVLNETLTFAVLDAEDNDITDTVTATLDATDKTKVKVTLPKSVKGDDDTISHRIMRFKLKASRAN